MSIILHEIKSTCSRNYARKQKLAKSVIKH